MPVRKKNEAFTFLEAGTLLALRAGALEIMQLEERLVSRNVKPLLRRLIARGYVCVNSLGEYAITQLGRQCCPCRNPHLAKLRAVGATPTSRSVSCRDADVRL
jgi:hypothetical protein